MAQFDQVSSSVDREMDRGIYVQQTLQLLGISIPPEQLPEVIANFEQVCKIAQPVLSFALPDDATAAARFEP